MPYCGNCGAYLPDGETVCAACGKNSADPVAAAQSAAAAAKPETDALHETLEEKLKEQQEKNKEYAQQLHSGEAHSTSQSTGGTPTAEQPAPKGSGKISKSRLLATLSYVGALCVLPFFLAPDDEFAKFHGKQGVVLFIAALLIDLLSLKSGLALIINIARIYLMAKGFYNALNDKMERLPWIGKFAEKL